jgi:hypothetical protein
MTVQQPGQVAAPAEQSEAEKNLHEDIERTRTELRQTVEQLAAKADVKSRARDTVRDLSGRVRLKAAESARRHRAGLTVVAAMVSAILAARTIATRRSRGNGRR